MDCELWRVQIDGVNWGNLICPEFEQFCFSFFFLYLCKYDAFFSSFFFGFCGGVLVLLI
jgi:hypothetical protein